MGNFGKLFAKKTDLDFTTMEIELGEQNNELISQIKQLSRENQKIILNNYNHFSESIKEKEVSFKATAVAYPVDVQYIEALISVVRDRECEKLSIEETMIVLLNEDKITYVEKKNRKSKITHEEFLGFLSENPAAIDKTINIIFSTLPSSLTDEDSIEVLRKYY